MSGDFFMSFIKLFYFFKPLIPRSMQIIIRSKIVRWKQHRYENIWPIKMNSASPPPLWSGWPEGKKIALILTHDVDTALGQKRSLQLMDLEKEHGFFSSFNFVPERYSVSKEIIQTLKTNNFEVGVHGLNHDGKLYQSHNIFLKRAKKINGYIKEWGAVGFRSPSMHHNLEWLHELNIEYDASTFDTDPFEPQSDGVNTIFPFLVESEFSNGKYIELPYTLVQDYTHFILLRKKDIAVWQKKLDWIVEKGGMALLNTHPDYMNFGEKKSTIKEYPVQYYKDFLNYVRNKYEGQYWHVLPHEIGDFWKHFSMK